ncbi:interleukin-15 receptor subunit alpha isoform X2 [Ictalurus punctatus]|uniref:Interleukin-15 receptor subunit alpha isoform X2 n=1 Tax=Ictalurus punctatus TaxID=7998 RepID=A0A2D0T4Q0_ICTPU|nr:interleukin-15 receptor subunit alpha isoform X2 [Ictalurus punctatus]
MRASILTFIFIISEYSIITGGYGDPTRPLPVATTLISTSHSPVTLSWFSPTPKTHPTTTEPESISTTTGKIVFTTTHTASTTSSTSYQSSQRTTTMEETPLATSLTARITASTTTEKENLTTVSSYTPSSISSNATKGITAGSIILVIIAGLAAAILFWRKRSKLRSTSHPIEMTIQNPDSDQPLIMASPITISCPPDSVQPLFTPFEDSPKGIYANVPLSA